MNRSVSASDKKAGMTLGELRELLANVQDEPDTAEVWGRVKIGGKLLSVEVRG